MNKDDLAIITEQLKLVVQVEINEMQKDISIQINDLRKENAELKHSLEVNVKKNEVLDLILQHDEIFNAETLPEIRTYLLTMIEREKKRQKFNDWAMKTIIGSMTIGVLTFVYSIGKFVVTNYR